MCIIMDFNNEQQSVRFDEENRMNLPPAETSRMTLWVMKYSGGLVRDEKQANYVLIGVAVIAFAITLFLIFGGGDDAVTPTPINLITEPQPPEGYIPR